MIYRSHILLFVTPWTVAQQAPLFTEFSIQEYWSRVGSHSSGSGDLPNPGIEPGSLALQADPLLSEPLGKPFPPHKKILNLTMYPHKIYPIRYTQLLENLPTLWMFMWFAYHLESRTRFKFEDSL